MAQMSRALLGAGRKVLVAMSGGVDSSVAAILLQKQGYTVEGMYMHNWDEVEESGHCPSDSDYESMKRVCKTLGIRSHRVNFVKQYWNNVFRSRNMAYCCSTVYTCLCN
jgi:tRNA-specific 2-thiouridylase